jgi:hypothetical protein
MNGGQFGPVNGVVFPPRSFSPGPMNGGQFGPGFGAPVIPGGGYGNQPMPFPSGPQQPPFVEPNHFGSGTYEGPRSRRSSRHRSGSRRRRRSRSPSSSSDDERRGRGSPYAGPGIPYNNASLYQNVPLLPPRSGSPVLPYNNFTPFPNVVPMSPRAGSPVIPQRPIW